jgi:2-succinyl-6-hydroxy-2,4-cyclohexadiene-1-carboxylate synthase
MEGPMKIHRTLKGEAHAASIWQAEATGVGVLAIHGFTGSGSDWAPIAEQLVCTVVAPDLLGHGDSPAPESRERYRIQAVADQCAAWCDSDRDWVVMGYSMGGRVALRTADLLGERLRGLVLISASPGLESPVERTERMAKDQALAGQIEESGVEWFQSHWSEQPIIQSQQQIPEVIRTAMDERRKANRAVGLAGSLRGMGQGVADPVWSVLSKIAVPTLVISGEEDGRYTEIAARTVSEIRGATHVRIPHAGHCTHLEAIEPVLAELRPFMSSISE